MPARLTLFPPREPAKSLWAEDGGRYLVGRAAECDLVAEDDRLSRRHAVLESTARGWLLADLASKNGVSVNGLAVSESVLGDPSWLSFGGLVADFRQISGDRLEAERQRRQQLRQETIESTRVLDRDLAERGSDARIDLQSLLGRLLGSLLDLTSARRAFVLTRRDDGNLEVAASAGLVDRDLESPRFRGSVALIQRALESERSVVVANVADEQTLSGRPSVVREQIGAMVCLPLRDQPGQANTLGAIYLDSDRPGALFEDIDIDILETLAERATIALSAQRLERELRAVAREMPTTERPPEIAATASRWTLSGLIERHGPAPG